jgi:hypothetical protein
MVGIKIVFRDLFRIECRKDLQFDDEALIGQMTTTEIARKVQHKSRILPEGEGGHTPGRFPKGELDCKQKS